MKKYWIGTAATFLLIIMGSIMYIKEKQKAVTAQTMALVMIGGADGPTSIFLAGKIGSGSIVIGIGVVLFLIGSICVLWKKKRR